MSQVFEDLVAATQRAALDPAAWGEVILCLESTLGDGPAFAHLVDTVSGAVRVLQGSGFDPDFMHSYQSYYEPLNPLRRTFPQLEPGRGYEISPLLPDDYHKSEFYTDWILPQDDVAGGALLITRPVRGRSMVLGVHIRASEQERREAPAARLLAQIEPHLSHAVAVGETISRLSAQRLPDAPRDAAGVVLMDEQRRLHWADEGAELVLRQLMRLESFGRLSLRDPIAERWLETVLSEVSRPRRGPVVLPVELQGVVVRMEDGARCGIRAAIIAQSLPSSPIFASGVLQGEQPSGENRRLVALFFTPQRRGVGALDGLRDRFALSRAEADVAFLMAGGYSTDEIALRRNASRHTVRNQIQALLVKLGVRNKTEAVSVILSLRQ